MCSIMGYIGDLDEDSFQQGFKETISRGPDMSKIIKLKNGYLGFHRLAIMELSNKGMQPFMLNEDYLVCNGEIYGFRKLKKSLIEKGYNFKSDSDCEILLPLYNEYNVNMFKMLDAEYALIIYDHKSNSLIAARDPLGIRPLYYGYDKNNNIIFASEPKNLVKIANKILPFPPGHYYKDGKFICYNDITKVDKVINDDIETVCNNIHDKLIKGVEKRLDADAKIGFLLSGGLDSSLVCAISSKILNKKIETFAIGMNTDAIDLKYAKMVADYIGSNHHEIIMTKDDVLEALEYVIKSLATYDITTIRASMGMYLICKAIHETTDIRVLLTGEISDELFGYKYTDFAPNAKEFQDEAVKRIHEIHMYDVLRADRCISVNSLEARVPFGDLDFVNYVMSIAPEMKMNKYNMGKYLLRHAFEKDNCLPKEILFRDKAAFSDAVGHSMVDDLKEFANNYYTDDEYNKLIKKYSHATPFTKESLLYREIFEKYYPGNSEMVKDFWMPNKSWEGCNVNDPSARVLSNYGNSGK
ncbi:MAG: asparagine synthase B [Acholeplasmatales bacterium]|nr:asparagine synthase B [Acholeplasmatales bacterium]